MVASGQPMQSSSAQSNMPTSLDQVTCADTPGWGAPHALDRHPISGHVQPIVGLSAAHWAIPRIDSSDILPHHLRRRRTSHRKHRVEPSRSFHCCEDRRAPLSRRGCAGINNDRKDVSSVGWTLDWTDARLDVRTREAARRRTQDSGDYDQRDYCARDD